MATCGSCRSIVWGEPRGRLRVCSPVARSLAVVAAAARRRAPAPRARAPTQFSLGGARVFNASGADVSGGWTAPSLGSVGAVLSANALRLRLFGGGGSLRGCVVAASGIDFVNSQTSTVEPALVVDHASGVVGGGFIDFAVAVGTADAAGAFGGADVSVAAGAITCGAAGNDAVAGPLLAGSPFAGVLQLGAALSVSVALGAVDVSAALGAGDANGAAARLQRRGRAGHRANAYARRPRPVAQHADGVCDDGNWRVRGLAAGLCGGGHRLGEPIECDVVFIDDDGENGFA